MRANQLGRRARGHLMSSVGGIVYKTVATVRRRFAIPRDTWRPFQGRPTGRLAKYPKFCDFDVISKCASAQREIVRSRELGFALARISKRRTPERRFSASVHLFFRSVAGLRPSSPHQSRYFSAKTKTSASLRDTGKLIASH
jgi:hypothetical protein